MRVVKIKKGFYRYIGQKRQAKESIPPLINEKGELATADMEKAEGLNLCFASVFTRSQGYISHIPGSLGGVLGKCRLSLPESQTDDGPKLQQTPLG